MTAPNSRPPYVLVDGSAYLFRAYHALPPLTTQSGAPTGALRGVLSMLKKLAKQTQAEHFVVVFDASGPTFRDELYADYKANRPPMPDDLRAQIAPLHELVQANGWPLLVVPGVEADDVIGTLARRAAAAGEQVLISTGDKDLAQLVDERITLINTMTDTRLDIDGVVEKFGVTPTQIIDWLTLVGDSVDNIPGVNKCGPKTAVKWLAQYGDLDQVVANAEQIGGKIGEHLRAALAHLPLSRELARIRTDLDLPAYDSLKLSAPDTGALRRLYEQFEFRGFLDEIETTQSPTDTPAPVVDIARHYDTLLTDAQLDDWIARLQEADLIALDTETTDLDYMRAELVGLSFAVAPGVAAYLPLGHDYPGAPEQLDRKQTLEKLRPLLEDPNKAKVGQNLKYDLSILARAGIQLAGIAHDTMLQSYVLNAVSNRHDMDTLAKKHLGLATTSFTDIAGKGAKQLTFNQIPLESAAAYAAEDADITLRLHQHLWPQLAQIPSLCQLYQDIELPLLRVLSEVERTGVLLDCAELKRQSQHLAEGIEQLTEQAYEAAQGPFNLGSPKQLGEVLYQRLELPVLGKTPKGAPSTAEDILERLAEEHALPRLVLEYRSLSKLKSTYTDKLPEMLQPSTGRVHTSYHQAVASTGRLSSSDPNLQNIPIRRDIGRRIRQAFIAPQGQLILAADYSQIELRIMAHLSADSGLLSAFAAEQDVHRATAAEVFEVSLDEVSADQRRAAKAINFGLIYGMSAFGLAKQLDIGRKEADAYVEKYFARYPGVQDYMTRTRKHARETGYVETLFGRRLYLPEINARNAQRRQYAERTAINAPMQGTAADIIKRAMLNVAQFLPDSGLQARMIMQVHDELVFEVQAEQQQALRDALVPLMEGAAALAVPLRISCDSGANWEAAH